MVKLCIFDMDGLLVDSERYMWVVSQKQAIKEQGFEVKEEVARSIMGLCLDDIKLILQEELGDKFDYDLYRKRLPEINAELIRKGIPLRKGARQLMDYLKSKGIKMCIGTTSTLKEASVLLNSIGITGEFDAIVCRDEIENTKPAPDVYLKCYSKFNIDKSQAIVLEDSNYGGLAALNAGIRLVLVPDIAIISEEVKNKAYRIVDDLTKVIDIIEEENERTISI